MYQQIWPACNKTINYLHKELKTLLVVIFIIEFT